MLIVHGTKKFRDRVRAPHAAAVDTSTTVLGAWYATAHFWRPQVAIFVNERTLHPLFVPLAPAATVIPRFADALVPLLEAYAAPPLFVEREVNAMRDYLLAPTASRSIVGTMNEFGHIANRIRDTGRVSDLLTLSLELGEVPCRVTGQGLFPDLEIRAIVHGDVEPEAGSIVVRPQGFEP